MRKISGVAAPTSGEGAFSASGLWSATFSWHLSAREAQHFWQPVRVFSRNISASPRVPAWATYPGSPSNALPAQQFPPWHRSGQPARKMRSVRGRRTHRAEQGSLPRQRDSICAPDRPAASPLPTESVPRCRRGWRRHRASLSLPQTTARWAGPSRGRDNRVPLAPDDADRDAAPRQVGLQRPRGSASGPARLTSVSPDRSLTRSPRQPGLCPKAGPVVPSTGKVRPLQVGCQRTMINLRNVADAEAENAMSPEVASWPCEFLSAGTVSCP
jgi:hypothetical protein